MTSILPFSSWYSVVLELGKRDGVEGENVSSQSVETRCSTVQVLGLHCRIIDSRPHLSSLLDGCGKVLSKCICYELFEFELALNLFVDVHQLSVRVCFHFDRHLRFSRKFDFKMA